LPFAILHAAESWGAIGIVVAQASGMGGSEAEIAVDIARLEWADIEAFDGKAEPALRPEDLTSAADQS